MPIPPFNHLGNVLSTVSDQKIQNSSDNLTVSFYTATVLTAQDYYPFGMLMPGRKGNSSIDGSGNYTWSDGNSGVAANLSYNQPRSMGDQGEYKATHQIEFMPGFMSGENGDSFIAYIVDGSGGSGSGSGPDDVVSGYRYGFNAKENDNDIQGEGDEQDYGMRIYDTRIGRFLSVDPLTKKYAMLTPYQFASNCPVQAVDLDGLEGVKYLEKQTDKDGKTVIKRVVEVDVYVAISRDENDKNNYYSSKPEKDVNIRNQVIGDLKSQFPDNKFKDDAGNDVIWRFNVQTFETDKDGGVIKKVNELNNDPLFKVDDGTNFQYRGFILKRSHLSDQSIPEEPTDLPVVENGETKGFVVQINNQFYSERDERPHTIGHETTHFFLRLHPDKLISSPDNTAAGHAAAGGGILNYGTAHFRYPGQVRTSPDEKVNVTFEGIKPLSQINVTDLLHSVPEKPDTPKQ